MKTVAAILAGGRGERLGAGIPKQFLLLAGREILAHAVECFIAHPAVDGVMVVIHPDHIERVRAMAREYRWAKIVAVLPGGATRQQSAAEAVAAAVEGERILIHDAARPLVGRAIIDGVLQALETHEAAVPVCAVNDTVLRAGPQRTVQAVVDRSALFRAQTPQGFRLEIIREAHRRAAAEGFHQASDDCGLVVRYGLGRVAMVPGAESNLKVTWPDDLPLAEHWLKRRGEEENP